LYDFVGTFEITFLEQQIQELLCPMPDTYAGAPHSAAAWTDDFSNAVFANEGRYDYAVKFAF
jgi:hypothetical protein